tara:strand:- start:58025 stop:58660 length:636 start_codon:yes stop_codon:yes gene_type:complete
MKKLSNTVFYNSTRFGLIICMLIITVGCNNTETPREKYRNDLREIVGRLVQKLNYVGTDAEEEVKTAVTFDGRSKNTTIMIPRSSGINIILKEFEDHLNRASDEFVSQDLEGFDEWGIILKNDIEEYKERIKKVTEQIKSRKEIAAYKNNFIVSDIMNMGVKIEINDGGELYLLLGNGEQTTTYFPNKTFDFDVDSWLQAVKARSQKFQKN